MKKLAVLFVCAMLAGCGESEVDQVKSMPIKGYGSYTYGKVLDNHKVCEKAEWKAYEEEGIKKVSYVCSLKKGKTSFNFDENVAARLRQEESNKYIAFQNNEIPKQIEANEQGLEFDIKYLDRLISIDGVKDYVKYMSELDSSDIIFTVPAEGIADAYSSFPDIRPYVTTLLGYRINVSNNIGYELLTIYKEKSAKGFTAEETAALDMISTMSRKYVTTRLVKEMKVVEERIAVTKDSVAVLKERLENPELIKKEAQGAGETAVLKYAMTHIVGGEEIIIWAWNPVDEKYNVERQYMKQIEYGDRYMTANLYIERLIYGAVNNISNVDTYMDLYRRTSLAELQNLIYKNN